MSEIKRQALMDTASDLVQYLDEHYAIEVDMYHIVEILNINLRHYFRGLKDMNVLEETDER